MTRLIIELDGHSHHTTAQYDFARERELVALGFTVVRFSNDEVIRNLSSVLTGIENALVELLQTTARPSPRPSPFKGEGAGENEAMETSK